MTTGEMRASGDRVPTEGWRPVESLLVRLSFNLLVLVAEHRFRARSERTVQPHMMITTRRSGRASGRGFLVTDFIGPELPDVGVPVRTVSPILLAYSVTAPDSQLGHQETSNRGFSPDTAS